MVRLPITEVAIFGPEMAQQIQQGGSTVTLQRLAVSTGMRTLRTTAIERVILGETTLAEIDRVVGSSEQAESGTAGTATVEQKGAQTAGVRAEEASLGGGAAILVVDDDPVQRLLVSATLEKHGYRVTQAPDGVAAMEWISAGEECALVLTDLHMPEMDGDMLIRTLRADPRTAALPVIVITGSAEEDKESHLLEIGADDYIRKPVDPPKLVARVRGILRRVS
jgi:CheY-like chemotaxis protein